MWRNVSFVERIELDFSGNIFNHAIVLGDVDNDQVTNKTADFYEVLSIFFICITKFISCKSVAPGLKTIWLDDWDRLCTWYSRVSL